MSHLIPSPSEAAMMIANYFEKFHGIELDENDIYYIRGLFTERDNDTRAGIKASIDVIQNMTVNASETALLSPVKPEVLIFANSILNEFKNKALRTLLEASYVEKN